MIVFQCGWKAGCDLAENLGLLDRVLIEQPPSYDESVFGSTYLELYRFDKPEILACCGWLIAFIAVSFCLWKLYRCMKFKRKTRAR